MQLKKAVALSQSSAWLRMFQRYFTVIEQNKIYQKQLFRAVVFAFDKFEVLSLAVLEVAKILWKSEMGTGYKNEIVKS